MKIYKESNFSLDEFDCRHDNLPDCIMDSIDCWHDNTDCRYDTDDCSHDCEPCSWDEIVCRNDD